MYIIKKIPEDFIVNEVNEFNVLLNGPYTLYKLTKKDYTTQRAILTLADYLKIRHKYFNYAGTKDKHAVTSQYITISKGPKKDIILNDIELKFLGYLDDRLNLGDLKGNNFEIRIQNINKLPRIINSIPNYFDSQRFGKNVNNHIIGKLIVKGNFKEALDLIGMDFNEFQRLPKNQSRLYIHAYQSYLFNKIVNKIIKKVDHKSISTDIGEISFTFKKLESRKIPLIGFGTEFEDKEIGAIIEKMMQEENLTYRDFIIRKMPHLTCEGDMRDMFVDVKNLEIGNLRDNQCTVKFFLPKGSYATMAIRAMMIK